MRIISFEEPVSGASATAGGLIALLFQLLLIFDVGSALAAAPAAVHACCLLAHVARSLVTLLDWIDLQAPHGSINQRFGRVDPVDHMDIHFRNRKIILYYFLVEIIIAIKSLDLSFIFKRLNHSLVHHHVAMHIHTVIPNFVCSLFAVPISKTRACLDNIIEGPIALVVDKTFPELKERS